MLIKQISMDGLRFRLHLKTVVYLSLNILYNTELMLLKQMKEEGLRFMLHLYSVIQMSLHILKHMELIRSSQLFSICRDIHKCSGRSSFILFLQQNMFRNL